MFCFQSHSADKKGTSHRSVSELLSNAAKKMNVEFSAEMHAMPPSRMTVYRQWLRDRDRKVKEMEEKLKCEEGPMQLMFDGKRLDGKERMAVIVEYLNAKGERCCT